MGAITRRKLRCFASRLVIDVGRDGRPLESFWVVSYGTLLRRELLILLCSHEGMELGHLDVPRLIRVDADPHRLELVIRELRRLDLELLAEPDCELLKGEHTRGTARTQG